MFQSENFFKMRYIELQLFVFSKIILELFTHTDFKNKWTQFIEPCREKLKYQYWQCNASKFKLNEM